ncbi:MAG: hypothetical protein WDN28_23565 [Chthoniobacter sp.]
MWQNVHNNNQNQWNQWKQNNHVQINNFQVNRDKQLEPHQYPLQRARLAPALRQRRISQLAQ